MNTTNSSGPPSCHFNAANLVLHVDEIIPSDVEAISPLVDKLMLLINERSCALGHSYAVEPALREALANAILHGNHQDPRKKVRICCACQAKRGIMIVVRDEGAGFDPSKVPSPLLGESLHSEHGRGIYLINMLMDEVHYERGGTEIHIRKY